MIILKDLMISDGLESWNRLFQASKTIKNQNILVLYSHYFAGF